MKNKKSLSDQEYYLGLDIGTDSVGYAVTDTNYALLKFKGEPMWGTMTFESPGTAAERRRYRSARRRLDRRQQRVLLLQEIFAPVIAPKDQNFFIRMSQSRLHRDEAEDKYSLFSDQHYTDKDYHKQYPTIHHLIDDLMNNPAPHDARLLYLACAWLIAHRGHFLFDMREDDVLDSAHIFEECRQYFCDNSYPLLWEDNAPAKNVLEIIGSRQTISHKMKRYKENLLNGRQPDKDTTEERPYSEEAAIKLLCGAKIKPSVLFTRSDYADLKSFSLSSDEDEFADLLTGFDDEDAELLVVLRKLYNYALLGNAQNGCSSISKAKIRIYEQHKEDLRILKYFVKKYIPSEWHDIFVKVEDKHYNYALYSYRTKDKSSAIHDRKFKKANKEDFYKFLKKKLDAIKPDDADQDLFCSMLERLNQIVFLPKQKDPDNRVIPMQLYRAELKKMLDMASAYLPFLSEKDNEGFTAADKILSIFEYRIPYFVGPLTRKSPFSWIERKAQGRIVPWNSNEKIDYDASEEAFIRRMTNTCTYCPGEPVLPKNSLLYREFTILNELAPLKASECPVPAEAKIRIFNDLFKVKKTVSFKDIKGWLIANNYARQDDDINGIDKEKTLSCRPWISFKCLLESHALSQEDVEKILERMAFTEDRNRLKKWLVKQYPSLNTNDIDYISRLNYKDFGSLSAQFLNGIKGRCQETGEEMTIIQAMRATGLNLNELLSSHYTFSEILAENRRQYYEEHAMCLSESLDDMYISSAVRRSIYRTLNIIADVEKAMHGAPKKIFVEMARGDSPEQKGKRTVSRKQMLLERLAQIAEEDARALEAELTYMGDSADNRLQSDKLFLYYLQLGKCAYTGESISLNDLRNANLYDIDHIYPQSKIKDDSLHNNLVLVKKEENGRKSDSYPLSPQIQSRMHAFWNSLRHARLMSDTKYNRLTRTTALTEDELMSFINRQLVETRQATKAVTRILQERYENSEIVFVKAGRISDFRKDFDMLKSRAANDMHHAKDAFLNIVVGNVWHMRFNLQWFSLAENYSIKTKTLFTHDVVCRGVKIWDAEMSLPRVRATMCKNTVRLTRFPFCRKGQFFDENPLKAGASDELAPIKRALPVNRYGGYDNVKTAFYLLAEYQDGKKKKEIAFVPVDIIDVPKVLKNMDGAQKYAQEKIAAVFLKGKMPNSVRVLFDGRPVKMGCVLSVDGFLLTLNSKTQKGSRIVCKSLTPLILGYEKERYVKRLENVSQKILANPSITPDASHDGITPEENLALYACLLEKMRSPLFMLCPGNFAETLAAGQARFKALDLSDQIKLLLSIIAWFGNATKCDLSAIGGKPNSGVKTLNAKISAWKSTYHDVRIIDMSASGLFTKSTSNIMDYLL